MIKERSKGSGRTAAGEDGYRRGVRRRVTRRCRHAARTSGLADYFAVDELDAIPVSGRRVVARLNWRKQGPTPGRVVDPLFDSENSSASFRRSAGAVRSADVIARIVDGSECDEFKALYGSSLVTGWATLYGYPIGILANHRGVVVSPRNRRRPPSSSSWPTPSDTPLLFLHNTDRLHGRQTIRGRRDDQARLDDDQRRLQTHPCRTSRC